MTLTSTPVDKTILDDQFDELLSIQQTKLGIILSDKSQLFLTDVKTDELWDKFIDTLSSFGGPEVAQHYTCSTCKETVRKFGGVVTILDNGDLVPVMWPNRTGETPLHFAYRALHTLVSKAKVVSLWVSDKDDVGVRSNVSKTGHEWTHFHFTLPDRYVAGPRAANTASQQMSKSKERFRILMNGDTGIHQFALETYKTAVMILEAKEINRSEHFLAGAQFHQRTKEALLGKGGDYRAWLWRELMSKPNGWENVNSTMLGTLYAWIDRGTPLDHVKRMWNERVKGENFQRPKAAPSEATIAQAEALVERMGIAKSLERRFARFEEIRCIWTAPETKEEEKKSIGVFSSVQSKEQTTKTVTTYVTSPKLITWEKFIETVLPTAEKIELLAPTVGNYTAFVTATHEDAPPILQWDSLEDRYPVSGYLYTKGSNAHQWGLSSGAYVNVKGITKSPGYGSAYAFLLDGCMDSNTGMGIALFPEILKSDLHGIRSVIEAFSNKGELSGRDEASACGYQISQQNCDVTLQVTANGETRRYRVDRMD